VRHRVCTEAKTFGIFSPEDFHFDSKGIYVLSVGCNFLFCGQGGISK
jgi:hypothetical protein